MTKANYYKPSRVERQVLAVLATAHIMQPTLAYNGFLWEDIEQRLPRGIKKREQGQAIHNLHKAGYIEFGATRLMEPGIFRTYSIASGGMRVALGVLG